MRKGPLVFESGGGCNFTCFDVYPPTPWLTCKAGADDSFIRQMLGCLMNGEEESNWPMLQTFAEASHPLIVDGLSDF